MWKETLNCVISYLLKSLTLVLPPTMVKSITDYCHIFNRDVRYLMTAGKVVRKVRQYLKEDVTISDLFEKNAKEHPDKICFYYEDSQWSFRKVREYSERVLASLGCSLDKGDVVALMLPNCPEFCCLWLGFFKAGIISAFLNTNIKSSQLLHCIKASKPKAIIYSNQFDSAFLEIIDSVEGSPTLYCLEGESELPNFLSLPKILEAATLDHSHKRELKFNETVIYIFTSGTTGMPKPSKITNSKLIGLYMAGEQVVGVRKDDVVYCAMPLYHTAATAIIINAFCIGFTVVLKTKFSASAIISDCLKYKATGFVYIGEMIRYVLNTKEQPGEKEHSIRFITGNGLRGDVWNRFVKRFNVPHIREFYGSTEGNFLLVNTGNVSGCCGFLPLGIPYFYLTGPSLIKVDEDTYQPIRGKDGLCIRSNPGEPGLCIGYCPAGNEMRKFHGYLNDTDTDSKRIRNVYKQGDMAFNTGDLMVMDERGWLTFVDRVGDTYRWKGENVSTTEVEEILNSSPYIEDSAVFGVQVGTTEGKAGMAVVIIKNPDMDELARFVNLSLPGYTRPLFLRLVDSLQMTGTFKVIKTQLKKQAFDISVVKDPLFVRMDDKYIPLTNDIYNQIQDGTFRL